jgi:hypothetical protein
MHLICAQVKVWFQNRRTKFKRTQQEEGDCKSGGGGNMSSRSENCEEDEDELIDMDDCLSGDDDM